MSTSSRFRCFGMSGVVFDHWLDLVAAHGVVGKVAHDARLAAAMKRHGLTHLMTSTLPILLGFNPLWPSRPCTSIAIHAASTASICWSQPEANLHQGLHVHFWLHVQESETAPSNDRLCSARLGNSPKVAQRSYLLVTMDDFQQAAEGEQERSTRTRKSGTVGASMDLQKMPQNTGKT